MKTSFKQKYDTGCASWSSFNQVSHGSVKIGGGDSNFVFSLCTSIGGGQANQAYGSTFGGVFSGQSNSLNGGVNGYIGGGRDNSIGVAGNTTTADYSYIGGGQSNTLDTTGGSLQYATIGGGQGNYIGPGTNHSSIFGGNGNTITGNCSAILGGSGNNDGGFDWVGIYGNALTATKAPSAYGVPSAFWADSLVNPSIPVITTLIAWTNLPLGALYTNFPTGTGLYASQVFVK